MYMLILHLNTLISILCKVDDFNPNSLDNKGSCWILKDFYFSVTMPRESGLMIALVPLGSTLDDNDPISIISTLKEPSYFISSLSLVTWICMGKSKMATAW